MDADFIFSLEPSEWVAAAVPSGDECSDQRVEFAYRSEGAALDGLTVDDPEPDLDDVHS